MPTPRKFMRTAVKTERVIVSKHGAVPQHGGEMRTRPEFSERLLRSLAYILLDPICRRYVERASTLVASIYRVVCENTLYASMTPSTRRLDESYLAQSRNYDV
ncbi:hypothetical protein EVAR_8312_1 [Eumeta japonica]|uniref:Uncharacterized protein n=1 Tax=Eumeta variegata TaxID=151549 RepID=A0A4C1VCY5_EUMVA|nr:hypothetical protein EVAR_8312_1 [Eumeta japonica]